MPQYTPVQLSFGFATVGLHNEADMRPPEKVCKTCGTGKPLFAYGAAPDCRDGHRGTCKVCERMRKPKGNQRRRCRRCEREFLTYVARSGTKNCGIYCSLACRYADQRGEKHANWRGPQSCRCGSCGAAFLAERRGDRPKRYCSAACRGRARRQRVPVPCRVCGVESLVTQVAAKRGAGVYCSTACRYRRLGIGPSHKQDVPAKICLTCGRQFASGGRTRRYCSRGCVQGTGANSGGRVVYVCRACGKEIISTRSRPRVACSVACNGKLTAARQQGAASHFWEGGKTAERSTVRNSLAYRDWRTQVFERDKHTCQLCGKRGVRLAAHHIRTFESCTEHRLSVANGITLCWRCHTFIRHKEQDYEAQFFAHTGGI